MRTRSALAGLVVVVTLGGLGAVPVGAEGDPTTAGDPAADTATPQVANEQTSPPATTTDQAAPADAPPPDDGAGRASSDPGPGGSGTDPADPPSTDAASGDPTGDPPTTDPADGTTTDPAAGPPATDPAAPPTDDGAGSGPVVVSSQHATVDAASHAVADTGHNTATNSAGQVIVADQTATAGGDGTGGAADPSAGNSAGGANSGIGLTLVVTGDASATGGASDDEISQKALVKALGTGEIEIIQIALVVNLGVGIANTGANGATGLDAVNVIGIGQGAVAGPGGAGGVATDGLTARNDASGNGAILTGDATAVGNLGAVQVIQGADAAAGSGLVASSQVADIASLGVAFGNTGINLVIGNTVLQLILVDQAAGGRSGGSSATAGNQATAGNSATGLAAIVTGAAGATGNASSTTIDQLAMADAGDGGFVSILQRALVLNLGIALANTGMNTAVGNQSLDLVDLQQRSIAGAFWASLQSLFGGTGWLDLAGTATDSVTANNTSDGTALVATGDATAIGLASTTHVGQQAAGSASAGGQAHVIQDATVTNAGLAIANTGANDAAGLLALNAVIAGQWAGLGEFLAGYLAQLGAGATTAAPATSSWDLGDVLVDLFGEIHADEVLIDGFGALSAGQVEAAIAQALGFAEGFDDITGTGPGGTGPRIRVRQVTGTLTINLGIASTGDNTAETATVDVVVVDQQGAAASESQVSSALGRGVRAALQAVADGAVTGDTALDPANLAVLINAATGSAVIVTGDATAGNSTTIAVCQTFETSAAVCSPTTPANPPVDPTTPTDPGTPAAPGGSGTWAAPAVAPPATAATPPSGGADPRGTVESTGSLPRTGADTLPLAEAGVVLVAAGMLLCLAAGARRRQRRPAHMAQSTTGADV
jgi:hypothetical protein